jgi:hypothetical protein
MMPVNKICTSSLRRTMGCRLMSTHHKSTIPQELLTKEGGPRHRAEDVLTDSSKFLYSSTESKFTSTMPFETLVQVITEQELAAAKKGM